MHLILVYTFCFDICSKAASTMPSLDEHTRSRPPTSLGRPPPCRLLFSVKLSVNKVALCTQTDPAFQSLTTGRLNECHILIHQRFEFEVWILHWRYFIPSCISKISTPPWFMSTSRPLELGRQKALFVAVASMDLGGLAFLTTKVRRSTE
mmetsp:Transcript_22317/g.42382  ORF Transcript_22317/g.42382 Transcript_22317/m.42382 type:complete len:150 (+) Transcript_22317:54-503(+)